MFKSAGRAGRSCFTMIELMIVVIIVAILAASAIPIYRSAVDRAYQAEIGQALGVIRSAQRVHLAENNVYAADMGTLGITDRDFVDMQYVGGAGEFGIVVADEGASFTATWTNPSVDDPVPYATATIDEAGTLAFNLPPE